MKTFSKIAVGAVAVIGLGFAVAAFSQGPGYGMGYGPGYGMGMHGPYGGGGYGPGMRGPFGFGGYNEQTLNENLTSLKSDLKITEEQAKAWEAFETAVRNQAKSVADMRATMYAGQANPEARYAIMQQRFAGIQAIQKARADLDNVLTAEQKEVFDRPGPNGYRGYCG
jgi:LTXXQ motif family protein